MLMLSSVLCFTACNNADNERNDHSTTNEEDISSEQLSVKMGNQENEEDISSEQLSVKIGNQEWASENLNVDKFKNGDAIPEAQTEEAWQKAGEEGKPAWCYYENDPKNGDKYGKLYNWYAVTDPRGLAPSGWHVPRNAEWTKLTDYLGGKDAAGDKMKSKEGWKDNGNGGNESGFSGLPGGTRYSFGTFGNIGYNGNWWSSTEGTTNNAWNRSLDYNYGNVTSYNVNKTNGFSVRCLRD